MPGLALESFETLAEAFLRARAWREHQFLTGMRPGRGLVSLYDEDFPDFTSIDLWNDLQAARPEDPRQLTRLSALLAAANLEGRTREFSTGLTRVDANATVTFEGEEMAWRAAPARWPLLGDVPRRHELCETWRNVVQSELTPNLERWQDALRTSLNPLGSDDWLTFWSGLYTIDLGGTARMAETVLEQTLDVYGHGLGVYLAQLDLPIDDVWTCDVDWAFRAARFDVVFVERLRMPTLIRTLRDLGIELEDQANIRRELNEQSDLRCIALEIPNDVRVVWRPVGGWEDFAHSLRGLGMAEHLAHADGSLRMWERWLGDLTPTLAYGSLLSGLLHDRTWLAQRMDYTASDDFLVIATLERLYRVRAYAALALFEQRLWAAEPGASMAADFEESLSGATRVRHFPEEYLELLLAAPWTALRSARELRAELFAAQLRLFLKREFDEEWWRASRASKFIKDELWRPARRYSAEELLGFMGYEGFDANVLTAEFTEVLQPL